MRKRIAILCSDDAHHKYLVALLCAKFDVVAVVVEPAASQRRRLRLRRQYKNYVYSLYHHLRRTILGLNAYRRKYFADCAGSNATPRRLVVDFINDPVVVQLLRETSPEITIVICTSILGREVLNAAGTTINVHGGFLPYYRGNHCFFFALYNEDFDKIGSTIHFVDPGIDTGDIIESIIPPLYEDDNAETLYCRADKLAIHRLVNLLDDYENGVELPRRPQSIKGKLYRTSDRKPHHDILLWLRRLSGSFQIPTQQGQSASTAAKI